MEQIYGKDGDGIIMYNRGFRRMRRRIDDETMRPHWIIAVL